MTAGIGTVESFQGEITVIRAGIEVAVSKGMPLYAEDVIKTGSQSNVKIFYIDETVTTLAGNSRMVINEVSYDSGMDSGTFDVDIDSGMFYFSSGEIAKSDGDVLIRTPAAEIGIRGTTLVGIVGVGGKASTFTLLNDATGKVGAIELSNNFGSLVLSRMGQTSQVLDYSSELQSPYLMTQGSIDREYFEVLSPVLEQYYKETDYLSDANFVEIFDYFSTQDIQSFAIEPMFEFVGKPSFVHPHVSPESALLVDSGEPGLCSIDDCLVEPPAPPVEPPAPPVEPPAPPVEPPAPPVEPPAPPVEPPAPPVEPPAPPVEPEPLTVYGKEDEPIALDLTEIEAVQAKKDSIIEQVTADSDGTGIEAEELDLAITEALESFSITILNVPDGATLSVGVDNGDGSWVVTMDQLTDLTITPSSNSDEDFELLLGTVVNQGELDAAELIFAQEFINAKTISTEFNDALVHLEGLPESSSRQKAIINQAEKLLSSDVTLPDGLVELIAIAVVERKAFSEQRNLNAFKAAAKPVIAAINESWTASKEAFEIIDAAQAIVDGVATVQAIVDNGVIEEVTAEDVDAADIFVRNGIVNADEALVAFNSELDVLVEKAGTYVVIMDEIDVVIDSLNVSKLESRGYLQLRINQKAALLTKFDSHRDTALSIIETGEDGKHPTNEEIVTVEQASLFIEMYNLMLYREFGAVNEVTVAEKQAIIDGGIIEEVTQEQVDAAQASLMDGEIINVVVEAVADVPTLTVDDVSVSGKVNQPIWLDISASLMDTDGSEKLSLIIFSDVVDLGDLGFSHGEFFDSLDYDNAWYFEEPSDWSNLSIQPTEEGEFTLSVVALSIEDDNVDVVESSIVNMTFDIEPDGGGTGIGGWF